MAKPFNPVPEATQTTVAVPNATEAKVTDTLAAAKEKKVPKKTKPEKELPPDINMENAVEINGKLIEIKPTQLRYFRNRTASIYNILKICPLSEFLVYNKGTFDEERDSDQILFDFFVAVFNDEDFVKANYDNIDMEAYEKILKIFGRINHLDEKEEAARKNREAQKKA